MKIAITADPYLPVPPREYGGIERIVAMLAIGLRHRGHDVTVFAHRDSTVDCERVPWPANNPDSPGGLLLNMSTLFRHVTGQNFDLVHSFSRVAYMLPLLPLKLPKVMTYQREVSPRSVRLGKQISKGSLHFTAVSRHMTENTADLVEWDVVPNGVPLETYHYVADVNPDTAPLVFLGRVEHIKGAHIAIQVAQQTGRKLVIAGNIPVEHQDYFEQQIRPHLNPMIEYVGTVDDLEKNRLLGGAAALLMPILWEEPFGIVMVEALACGTPVIAFRRGSVPEVVRHGKTGFVCENEDEMARAVGGLNTIRRADCRKDVEQRFSDEVVVKAYESLYEQLVEQG